MQFATHFCTAYNKGAPLLGVAGEKQLDYRRPKLIHLQTYSKVVC